jgi:hypothetical protein
MAREEVGVREADPAALLLSRGRAIPGHYEL